MLDMFPVQPEARQIVQAAAAVYLHHIRPHIVGLLVHGSALKGGFIPGCSDIDLKLYLADGAFTTHGQLPLALCLDIQRDLSQIDPTPFRYIQCDAISSTQPPNQIGPVPGTYHLIAGRLPVPEATEAQVRKAAHTALTTLRPLPAFVFNDLLEHGGGRLSATVRLLCTKVWPTLYNVLTIHAQDVFSIWTLPKDRAIALVPPESILSGPLRAFSTAVHDYYPTEVSIDQALTVIEHGIAVLQAASEWYGEMSSQTDLG